MFNHNASSTTEPMIRLENVSKQYEGTDKLAVAPLNLDIERGEFVCLVGPSGCGKTTTLRMINRLVEPSSGTIWINGKDVTHTNSHEMRRHIGYVIQQVGLLPHMTIEQNVGLVPKMLGWDRRKTAERVDELLELVGLDPSTYRQRYPKQLSGGQQQRVGVARALAADPPVMLMDEPFGAIDPITRDRLQEEFMELQKRIRKTIVFVTHDIDEALRLADRVAIFAEGSRIAQFSSPLEILSNPADEFVRTFIGDGAAVRRLSLLRVGDLAPQQSSSTSISSIEIDGETTVSTALERLLESGASGVHVRGGSRYTVQQMLMATTEVS